MTSSKPTRRRPGSRIAVRAVDSRIVTVRGIRVMLDADLAELYGVSTKALNQAVARNSGRFPVDFAFKVSLEEVSRLKSQNVTSNSVPSRPNLRSQIVTSSFHGGRRYMPRAFTEQGVAMLSSVLKSPRAVAVNVAIMRAFVRLRELALTHADLTRKLADLEKKYDGKFAVVFHAIRELTGGATGPEPPRPRIGFTLPATTPSARAKSHR